MTETIINSHIKQQAYFSTKQQAVQAVTGTNNQNQLPFCTYCKNQGKTIQEYSSHFLRESKSDKKSPYTCPEILKISCNICLSQSRYHYGHYKSQCPFKNKENNFSSDGEKVDSSEWKNVENEKKTSSKSKLSFNRFEILPVDDCEVIKIADRKEEINTSRADNPTPIMPQQNSPTTLIELKPFLFWLSELDPTTSLAQIVDKGAEKFGITDQFKNLATIKEKIELIAANFANNSPIPSTIVAASEISVELGAWNKKIMTPITPIAIPYAVCEVSKSEPSVVEFNVKASYKPRKEKRSSYMLIHDGHRSIIARKNVKTFFYRAGTRVANSTDNHVAVFLKSITGAKDSSVKLIIEPEGYMINQNADEMVIPGGMMFLNDDSISNNAISKWNEQTGCPIEKVTNDDDVTFFRLCGYESKSFTRICKEHYNVMCVKFTEQQLDAILTDVNDVLRNPERQIMKDRFIKSALSRRYHELPVVEDIQLLSDELSEAAIVKFEDIYSVFTNFKSQDWFISILSETIERSKSTPSNVYIGDDEW